MQALNTPLEVATVQQDHAAIKQRFALGDTPQDLNHMGIPVLYDALKTNDLTTLGLFFDAGMDLTLPYNQDGYIPFVYACLYCELATVAWLVDTGVDVNLRTAMGISAMHVAAQRGDLAIIKYLYQHGAQVFCYSKNQESPLYVSLTAKKSLAVFRFLLQCYHDQQRSIDDDLMPCIAYIFDKQHTDGVDALAALLPFAAYVPEAADIHAYLSIPGNCSSTVLKSLDITLNSKLSNALFALLKAERVRRASGGLHSATIYTGVAGL